VPRLRNDDYIRRHKELAQVWELASPAFALLSPRQQRGLHDYYGPAENLSENKLVEHRKATAKLGPSLPNRAGKALAILRIRILMAHSEPRIGAPKSRVDERDISVHPIVQPEIDLHLLASTLISQVQRDGRKRAA
jgi:hypothetical protein